MFTKADLLKTQQTMKKKYPQFRGFQLHRLKDFLSKYDQEIDYEMVLKKKNTNSPYEIICLVDTRVGVNHTMSRERRRKLSKSGGAKRRRIKEKYHYDNVFNRIHGYLLLEDKSHCEDIPEDKKVISLSLICRSFYSNMRGVGNILMDSMIGLSKEKGYTDIILEVANEYAGQEDDDDEDEEEVEIYMEESDSEDEYYSDDEPMISSVNEELIDRVSREFIRKIMRLNDTIAYFNIGEDYITDIVTSYIDDEYEYEDYEWEFEEIDFSELGENQYGGFWYHKGKQSQMGLYRFYEKFGFKEDFRVHYEWKAYTTDPFPSMILSL